MSSRWFAFAALLIVTFTARAADSTVNFNTNVFRLPDGSQDPSRLVRFGSTYGALSGTGVRNGVNGAEILNGVIHTASYVAQLFMVGAGGVETAVGTPADFRAATTSQPGTWSGASRTLVGVEPGTSVNLIVKVWDNRVPSYEVASTFPAGLIASGKSSVFTYTQPETVLLPSDLYMVNFSGFALVEQMPEPSVVALAGLGLVGLLLLRRK